MTWLRSLPLWAALALTACGPQTYIIQQYDGPVRDRERIAILRINGADPIRVLTLDGELADARLDEEARLHIEVLPGRHVVRVGDAERPEAGSLALAFQADAGRVYRAALYPPRSGVPASAYGPSQLRVFEVDRSSDALLRDVTAPASVEPAFRGAPSSAPTGSVPSPPPPAPTPTPTPPPSPSPAPAPPPPVPPAPPPPSPAAGQPVPPPAGPPAP